MQLWQIHTVAVSQSVDAVHYSIEIKNSIEIKVTNRIESKAQLFYASFCSVSPRLIKIENESQSNWCGVKINTKTFM